MIQENIDCPSCGACVIFSRAPSCHAMNLSCSCGYLIRWPSMGHVRVLGVFDGGGYVGVSGIRVGGVEYPSARSGGVLITMDRSGEYWYDPGAWCHTDDLFRIMLCSVMCTGMIAVSTDISVDNSFMALPASVQSRLVWSDGSPWVPIVDETAWVDAIPYCARVRQSGVVHISKMDKHPCGVVCVVGKGPSADKWSEIPADVFITINDACYLVDRACYAVRGDGCRHDHRFMEWLPSYCTPIMPARLRDVYNYGWWFTWSDIGLENICLTTLMAIRLAYYYFIPKRIVVCGLDGLVGGSAAYHPSVANERNRKIGHRDQRLRVRDGLPREIYSICMHWDGKELVR